MGRRQSSLICYQHVIIAIFGTITDGRFDASGQGGWRWQIIHILVKYVIVYAKPLVNRYAHFSFERINHNDIVTRFGANSGNGDVPIPITVYAMEVPAFIAVCSFKRGLRAKP